MSSYDDKLIPRNQVTGCQDAIQWTIESLTAALIVVRTQVDQALTLLGPCPAINMQERALAPGLLRKVG